MNDLLDEMQSSQVHQSNFPYPSPIAKASFLWGDVYSATLIAHMNEAYCDVHWKMNYFYSGMLRFHLTPSFIELNLYDFDKLTS